MAKGLNHLRACAECPKFKGIDMEGLHPYRTEIMVCSIYKDTDWVNRRGGCPAFPYREIPRVRGEYVDGEIVSGSMRPGQQKQKKADRNYNNAKANRKYGRRSQ